MLTLDELIVRDVLSRTRPHRRRQALHPIRQRAGELRQSSSQRPRARRIACPDRGGRLGARGAHAAQFDRVRRAVLRHRSSGRGRRAREHRVSRPHARVRPERCCVPGPDRRRGVPAGTAGLRRPAFSTCRRSSCRATLPPPIAGRAALHGSRLLRSGHPRTATPSTRRVLRRRSPTTICTASSTRRGQRDLPRAS